jgi:hypothetical protein
MLRALRDWTLRSLWLVAFVVALPLGQVAAQETDEEAAGPAPMAEEAPIDPGPDVTVLPDMPNPRAADVSPSAVTGVDVLDPNAPSPEGSTLPEGGEGNGGD